MDVSRPVSWIIIGAHELSQSVRLRFNGCPGTSQRQRRIQIQRERGRVSAAALAGWATAPAQPASTQRAEQDASLYILCIYVEERLCAILVETNNYKEK